MASALRTVAALVALGAAATLSQLVVLREYLVACLGNELSLGLVLALWLTGAGLGSLLAGRIVRRGAVAPSVVALTAAPLPLLALVMVPEVAALLSPGAGQLVTLGTLLGGAGLLVLPLGLVLGLPFPLVCAAGRPSEEPGRRVAALYAAEALGSMVGGLSWTFVLAGIAGPALAASVAGWSLALAALLLSDAGSGVRRVALGVLLVLALVCAGSPVVDGRLAARRLELAHAGLTLVDERDTPYQRLTLTESAGQYDLFGDGHYWLSFPDPVPTAMAADQAMTLHPAPRRVALLGGLVDGFVTQVLRHCPERVSAVELDPAVLQLTLPHLSPADRAALVDGRVSLVTDDPRRWLAATADASFDLVVMRLPEPVSAMLNRFWTVEFAALVRRKLAVDGILVTWVTGSPNHLGAPQRAYLATILDALGAVFPRVEVCPGDRTLVAAAGPEAGLTLDLAVLQERWRTRPMAGSPTTAAHLALLVDEGRVAGFRDLRPALRASRRNRDAEPAAYYRALVLWDAVTGTGAGRLLGALTAVGPAHLVAVMVLVALGASSMARWGGSGVRRAAAVAAGVMGLAGAGTMVLHLVVVLAYQTLVGSLYERMGLALGLFMAGLALGGLSGRALGGERAGGRLLAGGCLAAALTAWAAPRVLATAAGEASFVEAAVWGLLALGGFLPGFVYARAAACAAAGGATAGIAAAVVHGADILGGATGAASASLVLVPLMGFEAALHLAALAFGLAALVALAWRRAD